MLADLIGTHQQRLVLRVWPASVFSSSFSSSIRICTGVCMVRGGWADRLRDPRASVRIEAAELAIVWVSWYISNVRFQFPV